MNTKTDATLPVIGQPFEGGIFAGITLDGDQRVALILLPGDKVKDWKDAGAWANDQGGELPSRIDMLVLFKNQRDEFKRDWYWTAEEVTGYADFAWVAGFSDGGQYGRLKTGVYRCRAVRRVAI